MSREALKQALEALERASKQIIYANVRPEQDILISITAIKTALAQEKGLFVDLIEKHDGLAAKLAEMDLEQDIDYWIKQHTEARQAELELRRELEALKTEQEPVAWRNAAIRVGEDLCSVGPFGYYDMTAEQWLDWALSVVTVHASPPQRQPLPAHEIVTMYDESPTSDSDMIAFARAIEKAHGIKGTT